MNIKKASANLSQPARVSPHANFNFDELPDTGFMRQPKVLEVVPFSSATLWRKCKSGAFPKPSKLSERVTAWNVGAVRAWLNQQMVGV